MPNNIYMQQNSEEDNSLELQLLYYIHQEIVSSEEIHKILWNQKIQNWEQLTSQNYDVNIIGLYGIVEDVCENLEKRLGNKIKLSEEALKHNNKSMICFLNHESTYYIAYIGLDEQLTKDYFNESIDVSLFRYLKDLCSQIILLPSKQILKGWKKLEQVFNMDQSSIIQEYSIQDVQDDHISCSQIELRIDQKDIQQVQNFQFGQENIRAFYSRTKQNQQFVEIKILEDIFYKLWQGQDIKNMNLSDFKAIVQDIIKQLSIPISNEINSERSKKFSKCNDEKQDNFFIQYGISNMSKLVFTIIWDNMPIHQNLKYDQKFEQILITELKTQNHSISHNVSNWYFKDNLQKIFNQQIGVLNHFSKKNNKKKSNIKDIFEKFTFQFYYNLNKQLQSILEIKLYKFTSILSEEQKIFGILEQIQVYQLEIKDYFQLFDPESVGLAYYFRTKKTKQNMFIFQSQNQHKQYEYKWVVSLSDKLYKTIFTFKQQSNALLFYFDVLNSKLYVFNCNNGINVIQFDEEKKLIIRDSNENHHYQFDDCCYLNHFGCFMFLGYDKVYQWTLTNKIEQITLSYDGHCQKYKYQKILSVGSGYYYCLVNLESCDIFNFNNELRESIKFYNHQIKITSLQQINLFADQSDWFLTIINKEKQTIIQIKNVNTKSQIIKQSKDQKKSKYSNPFLDVIKSSINKFGLSMQLILTAQQVTELFVTKDAFQIIYEYFDFLNLHQTDRLVISDSYKIKGQQVKISELAFVMISRVALQLCTIEQSILVPLQLGQYQRNLNISGQEKTIDILEKIEQLNFGIFEMIQNFSSFKIFVVSIMGRQSCGKSYLMNRLFGTRFGVSSARCTDGIQMSLSKIDNSLFILLDCEGLFSQRRTSEEEKMLLIFLTGLSDVTILNQDLTFNRNMNEVFANLSNCSDQINGDNLFQGKLIIAVRDVNQDETEAAQRELLQNIQNIKDSQQNDNFLSRLFNGDFITILMSHFENKYFEYQVQEIRRKLISMSNIKCKWSNYKQLLYTMKIMLVQLEVNDYRKLDDILLEHNIKKIKNQAINLCMQYQIDDIDGINVENLDQTFQILKGYFQKQEISNQQKINHNEMLKDIEQKIKQFLVQREDKIVEKLLSEHQLQFNKKSSLISEIRQLLYNFNQQFYFCEQKCSICNLNCNNRVKHSYQQQVHHDAISSDMESEKIKLNQLKDRLKMQNNSNTLQHDVLKQQFKDYNKEKQYLQLILNKQEVLIKLNDLFKIEVEEQQINQQMIQFLHSNFIRTYDEINQESCLKIIQNDQFSLIQDLNEKIGTRDSLVQENQKINQYQLKYNQLKLDAQYKQEQLNKQILEINCQIQVIKQSQQVDEIQSQSKLTEISPELQNNLDELYIQKTDLLEKLSLNNNEISFKKEQIIKDLYGQEIEFIIEFDLLPKLESKKEELMLNFKQQDEQLQKCMRFLQNASNNQQQIQVNKINNEIQKIQNYLKLNKKNQETIEIQIYDLKQVNLQGQNNNEHIAQLILKIDHYGLLEIEQKLKEQLDLLLIDIHELESQLKFQNLRDQLALLEQDLVKYNSELLLVNQEYPDDIEILIQESFESQEKIFVIDQQIEILRNQIKLQEDNLEIFKQIRIEQNLLMDYNSKLEDLLPINLSGQNLEYIEKHLQELNQQILQFEQINKINQLMEQSENIIRGQEYKLIQMKNEIQMSHNCGFLNHDCDQICQGCNNPNVYCKFKAGHNDSTHLCENNQHFCKSKCKIWDCNNACQLDINHNNNIEHNCQEYHQCHNKCQYCLDICSYNASDDHQVHQCQKKYCTFDCYFLDNKLEEKKCKNGCSKLHNEAHDLHLCLNEHQCNHYCEKQGICQIGNYTEKNTVRETENGSFQFIIYEQNAETRQCWSIIQKGHIKHQGQHQCEQKVHTCNKRCPECNAYCDKPFGHKDKHSVNQHRNKEKQQFTLLQNIKQDKVEIYETGTQSRIYKVGENCQPETCSKSCLRRERAHYHLIPCPGQGKCLANQLNNQYNQTVANHQLEKYKGSDLIYDEILCNQYWENQDWEHPVDKKLGQLISLCSYYCKKCDKEQNEKYFCTQQAWHSKSNDYDSHQFSCQENHKFNGIDIVFVIDSTNSMEQYLKIIKNSIDKFKRASDYYQKDKNAILYSIVSYTDHDKNYKKEIKQECVNFIDFTNYQQAQQFVQKIKFEYSSDCCEAMMDGLHKASQLKWREKSKKFMFLIADAPPHGRNKFHNYTFNYRNDNFPEGCPCGLKEDQVLKKLIEKQIKLVVLKLNSQLNMTIKVFESLMRDISIIQSEKEVKIEDYIQQLEKMICEQLSIQEITIGNEQFK